MMTPLSSAPTLITRRLTLRGPSRDDLPYFSRFVTSAPSLQAQGELGSPEDAWFGFMIGIGHWQWHGFGFFTVVEQKTHLPVGRVGLLKHAHWPDVELAWHLFEGAEGKGYATEAALAVKQWAYAELGLTQLYSYIDIQNFASQAVARRLGAVKDGTMAQHEPEAEVWVHQPSSDEFKDTNLWVNGQTA